MHYDDRSHWVRLRTLVWLRWVAIVGQIAAILIGQAWFDLQLPVGLCFLAVGLAIIGNLTAIFIFPENKRLAESEALAILLFDLGQLGFLLYLTGGLNNPFSLLILAPVTVAATALHIRSAVIVGVTAGALVSFLAFVHIPLRNAAGVMLAMPDLFLFGFWAANMIGIGFLSAYAGRVTSEINSMSDALIATQMALAREQKLTDLGGVVAAAAHELGTPLATIKLVSSELADELDEGSDLYEDAKLIGEQADRCRDILRSMGRAGKDDLHLRNAPFATVVSEAAEPHQNRGKSVHMAIFPDENGDPSEPLIRRHPEIIHGIRNLVQNAVDFAAANVWIELYWTPDRISLRIMDDGRGYPPQILTRIGDPFVRSRRGEDEKSSRPGYEGMGLGLFIAKTLLERTGAELTFANGTDPFDEESQKTERCGAIVAVDWPRDTLERNRSGQDGEGLGENTLIEG